jgi:peptidyl-prolyl cis-trans isomerase B (cyclophilin B)
VASSKQRERKLARARYERQMVNRARQQRRRRQIQAGIGASLILALIVAGVVWMLNDFRGDDSNTAAEQCAWTPRDPSDTNLTNVGTPPTNGNPEAGSRPMTITTNSGAISVNLDLASAPCAGASLAHLAKRGFFDDTHCHELTADGALRCGDKAGTGLGGPTYSFYGENVPAAAAPAASPSPAAGAPVAYPRGTVALVPNTPGSGSFGSQFLIFHKDATIATPEYSIVGTVTGGLDVLDAIVKSGTVADATGQLVKPKNDVVIQSLTVGEVAGATPSAPPAGTSPTTGTPAPSASAAS